MYVIQSRQVEILQRQGEKEFCLVVLSEGDFLGEMALFNREVRSATVRALGEVRALTVDKKTFLRRVHEDPSLAFGILQKMSRRIRDLNAILLQIATHQRQPLSRQKPSGRWMSCNTDSLAARKNVLPFIPRQVSASRSVNPNISRASVETV